jgi:hypothetical protein
MQWKAFCRMSAVGLLSAAMTSCMQERVIEVSEITTPTSIPTALRGQATILRLVFPLSDQQVEPGEFKQGEICYLTVGEFRIDCAVDGSALNLGPNDSNDLLMDNPMIGLEPAHDDKAAAQTMKLYGILFLVGGTLDRLPGALADYIQDPGQHLNEALALTDLLLTQKQVEFMGFARGGNFTVSVELTDAGRDKLSDALDEIGQPTGSMQLVGYRGPNVTAKSNGPR